MERFLEPCEDITADGTIIHEQLDAADETRQLDIKKIFRRKATTATAAAAANAPNPVEALNQDRVHTDMKDRIYYAREEVRCAIDILLKLEATVQEPGGPQQPAAEKPLITIAPTTKQSVSNIPKQIDQIKSTLSAKKMHLIQISSAFDKAATRLNSTLANEMKFYGQVAIQQLRRHNWILHSKDERTGRGLYVDYGLTKAGSTSTEICEAYFTWSSSAVSSTKTATKNKITLKYGHGRPKLVQVLHKSGCSTNIPSLPCDYPEYSKIQKALSAAKQAAFDTELFHEYQQRILESPALSTLHQRLSPSQQLPNLPPFKSNYSHRHQHARTKPETPIRHLHSHHLHETTLQAPGYYTCSKPTSAEPTAPIKRDSCVFTDSWNGRNRISKTQPGYLEKPGNRTVQELVNGGYQKNPLLKTTTHRGSWSLLFESANGDKWRPVQMKPWIVW
ncbi:hypothetical protein BDR26DRAFT_202340 [Obelidium mucronatum]|nr:hypothetical protein BDR26DRAFT_202340 [Obelidium mucronatum]